MDFAASGVYLEIKDKKRSENMVADHLSRLELDKQKEKAYI